MNSLAYFKVVGLFDLEEVVLDRKNCIITTKKFKMVPSFH